MAWMRGSFNNVDLERLRMLDHLMHLTSLNAWPLYDAEMGALWRGRPPTGQQLIDLGDHLGRVFGAGSAASTPPPAGGTVPAAAGVTARSSTNQSRQGSSGTAWEAMVVWYLNLIAFGTPLWVARGEYRWLPRVTLDAIAIKHGTLSSTKEADIVAFNVPEELIVEPRPGVTVSPLNMREVDAHLRRNPAGTDLRLISAKTNWNDTVQAPALANMIFELARTSADPVLVVGMKGVRFTQFRSFAYSFVTVPSGSATMRVASLPVQRVSGLSGGNYWGKPTEAGVASGFSEYLLDRMPSVFGRTSLLAHVEAQMAKHPDFASDFRSRNF